MDHDTILQQVIAWAHREDSIRAVVLTGSVARGEGAFDELSDLDLELYVSNPSDLLVYDAWYHQFGEVLVVEALDNPGWHPTRLVYDGNGKIDFMVDWDSKNLLLKMLEWDHRARKGWDSDTGHLGTHLREWADVELAERIDGCWSGFSRPASVQALLNSISLFDALSTRTGRALGFEPFDASRVRQRVDRLLSRRLE